MAPLTFGPSVFALALAHVAAQLTSAHGPRQVALCKFQTDDPTKLKKSRNWSLAHVCALNGELGGRLV